MKMYHHETVYDAALARTRWLFDEFENIGVFMSGGKDSTVIFNIALQVAKEKGRLPLKTVFIDQEAEWTATIEYIKSIMYRPDVEPYWYQFPFQITNATTYSGEEEAHWLYAWKEGETWLRDKDPISRKKYPGTEVPGFKDLFPNIATDIFGDKPCAFLGGVRAEESPTRFLASTEGSGYKWVTWMKRLNIKKGQFTFYPIYDWDFTDVWKYICDNNLPYNKLYDLMYQRRTPIRNMRISSLTHEIAVVTLFMLQEVDPELYAKFTKRMPGIDTAMKMGKEDYFIRTLPYMFTSWPEYRDYLLPRFINNKQWRDSMTKVFIRLDEKYKDQPEVLIKLIQTEIKCIFTMDIEMVRVHNFLNKPIKRKERYHEKPSL